MTNLSMFQGNFERQGKPEAFREDLVGSRPGALAKRTGLFVAFKPRLSVAVLLLRASCSHRQASKAKPQECEDANNVLTAMRSCFSHNALDYVFQVTHLRVSGPGILQQLHFHVSVFFSDQCVQLEETLRPAGHGKCCPLSKSVEYDWLLVLLAAAGLHERTEHLLPPRLRHVRGPRGLH